MTAERIVVTGSSGMLGSAMVRHLARERHEVLGVDVRPPLDPVPGCSHRIGDVRDSAFMARVLKGAGTVLHCAAALPSYSAEQNHDINVNGTRSVLTAGHQAGVGRVVHVSSTAVYGLPKIVPTTEDHPREPVDPYTRAKAEAEEVAEEFRAAGMCVTILRPKTFIGPGRLGLFAMIFEWADEGRNFPILGRGDALIQMLAVEDLVTAISHVLAADEEVANDTYNLGAAEFGTLREDFQAVLDAAGHGKRVVSLPARPALTLLRALDRARLSPVYERLLRKLLDDSYVSIDKARERLGFEPQLSNGEAILRTYEWWRTSRPDGPRTGRTSGDAWRQRALSLAKVFF
ncbi:NAD-dependent epimerase/dehydratase family protein [Actinomadura sp. 7K534]|uniref:NAD-dependent epimerase/dehydratase family protein n=1 Tax=Actinomadura sp. 7K534 TaxID=2530366 RepID=UPI001046F303|nr:NAD-dependent epimerase/dehydratase family protein [Actinomadura sp. 7K534]TDB94046.1 NAD-dependent epimerase/dehydratase family protein [Actinomadura sp. 7K534]